MSQSLLATRRFAPLFWCQFFSAFNDNFLKNALALLILFKIGGQSGEALVTLAGGVFIAPFFLLSAVGGELADRFRQGGGGAHPEAHRNRRGGGRRRRVPAEFAAALVPCAVPVRPDRGAVRADQIRHPARSSEAGGVAGGQCARRGRHLSRDPRRHDRRRLRDDGRRRSHGTRCHDDALFPAVLGCEPVHPEDRAGSTGSEDRSEHSRIDRQVARRIGRTPGCGAAPSSPASSGWSARSSCRCCRRSRCTPSRAPKPS
jgi:hypothetical protein